jgi:hypothetical protein
VERREAGKESLKRTGTNKNDTTKAKTKERWYQA